MESPSEPHSFSKIVVAFKSLRVQALVDSLMSENLLVARCEFFKELVFVK